MTEIPPLPPTPEGNEQRLSQLEALAVLDSANEASYDEITAYVSLVCDVPTALVSLVDRDRQWFKSKVGFDEPETPLNQSVCAYVVYEDHYIEIEDLTKDPRTAQNPLVTAEGGIRFYAGSPLRLSTGAVVGALCAIDTKPRVLTDLQRETLRVMARQVVAQMELHQSVQNAEMLAREVDHRVKNSLQSITSLTRIQARKAPTEDVALALTQVQARIEMVAALHEQLYHTSAGHEVNIAPYIKRVASILSATAPEGVAIKATCAATTINARQAGAIGVILNEFAANSFKHAFPEGRRGTVSFDGRRDGGDFILELADDGVGMGAVTRSTGIGLAVIEASVAQLGGAWEPVAADFGTHARLRFPIKQFTN